MASFGKPDATGRSSGKRTGREGKVHRPPPGASWVWLTREFVASPAWRAQSRTAVKIVNFLMIEHMNHAGTENGNLKAPYDHLVTFGCSRRLLKEAISELQFLGLVEVTTKGGRWAGTNQPSSYRLTWLTDRDNRPPTNEWEHVTEEAVAEWCRNRRSRRKARRNRAGKQNHGSRSGTTVVPHSELPNRNSRNAGLCESQIPAVSLTRS